jgi:hypothetical protein
MPVGSRVSPKKIQVINRAAAQYGAAAGTKWNAFIDAGCASHMKKPASQKVGTPQIQEQAGITAHQVP